MASAPTLHVTACHCTEAELVERLAAMIYEHIEGNRHPDGIAPFALAEDLVVRLRRGHNVLFTREDAEA